MSERAITDTGSIVNVDPYTTYGVGLPDGWLWLDELGRSAGRVDPDRLPDIIRGLDRRLLELEAHAHRHDNP